MKKLFAALLFSIMIFSLLTSPLYATSGGNGSTDVGKKTPDVSQGWSRYELESYPVVNQGAETNSFVQAHALYSDGKGQGGFPVVVLNSFEDIVFQGETAYIKVTVNSDVSGDTQMTLFVRKNFEEINVAVKVNNGAVNKLVLPAFPDSDANRMGFATMNIHLEKGANTILISAVHRTEETKRFWANYDCIDIKDITASGTDSTTTAKTTTSSQTTAPKTGNASIEYIAAVSAITFACSIVLYSKARKKSSVVK